MNNWHLNCLKSEFVISLSLQTFQMSLIYLCISFCHNEPSSSEQTFTFLMFVIFFFFTCFIIEPVSDQTNLRSLTVLLVFQNWLLSSSLGLRARKWLRARRRSSPAPSPRIPLRSNGLKATKSWRQETNTRWWVTARDEL